MEVIPYLPTLRQMRLLMKARLAGEGLNEALRRITAEMRPRDLARTLVAGAHGQQPLRLSVAIEGGSSVVKRGRPQLWRISDHGRWRRMHLGAIEAAYSSAPFFPHLFPEIERILLMEAEAGLPFTELTSRLFDSAENILQTERILPSLISLRRTRPEFLETLIKEKNSEENDDLAFLDVIFRKGPESIFSLLSF